MLHQYQFYKNLMQDLTKNFLRIFQKHHAITKFNFLCNQFYLTIVKTTKELNFIYFLLPKGGHCMNFGDLAYLLFCKCSAIQNLYLFFTLRNLSLPNEKMSFILKDYLQKIWIINFRY